MTATGVMGECERRLTKHYFELRRLYGELYNGDMRAFDYFCTMLRRTYGERSEELRRTDREREKKPEWYRDRNFTGMTLYAQNFAGTLKGVESKLDYIRECGVDFLHIQPFLASTKGRDDGGYAVSDYRKVNERLGTVGDLESLTKSCHEQGILLSADFVMNHTSEDHPWAKAARAGDPACRSKYFFFDDWEIPNQYEQSLPQVFPTTAPGNFTYLPDCDQVVMTFFYPYQWDLNYRNPMVLNDMTENLLFLANRGMDVLRLDAIPYIWKELGTDCRNRPEVHKLARLLNLACQVVCPGVLLLGEVVMEPEKVAPYFGTPEKPECQILYNVTTMCTTWHTVATRDVGLLRRQAEQLGRLPGNALFQNYLRCHDDIGWGLDYPWLGSRGYEEGAHKKYLNDWFTGVWPGSWSRGELYNDDPRLRDARLCGTTASLVGMESEDPELRRQAIRCDEMLHAWMLTQSGIPVLYSGDEIGQFNDYSYHDDPDKRQDSRYLHRGKFNWELAALRHDPSTLQGELFQALRRMERRRAELEVFRADAVVSAFDTGSDRVLGIRRSLAGQTLTALFNFSEAPQNVGNPAPGGRDALTREEYAAPRLDLPGYGFAWILTEG